MKTRMWRHPDGRVSFTTHAKNHPDSCFDVCTKKSKNNTVDRVPFEDIDSSIIPQGVRNKLRAKAGGGLEVSDAITAVYNAMDERRGRGQR